MCVCSIRTSVCHAGFHPTSNRARGRRAVTTAPVIRSAEDCRVAVMDTCGVRRRGTGIGWRLDLRFPTASSPALIFRYCLQMIFDGITCFGVWSLLAG
eukprot:NODE_5302_length_517_cov_307.621795_g3930_i0.p2 GENE.NODE_5302_length_517_cov_307.621795_g3930_i0~~NODE_5302_length_517_cov_307.621795_g3930_i0.p2  ORF type:complete len:98 (+),score=2.69 NODE_5302_length_517_cov_307.621795_g3930_i0:202-495(+)